MLLTVSVDSTGQVDDIRTLQETALLTEAIIDAVRQWRFEPATSAALREDARPVATDVLVAAVFRSPMLYEFGPEDRTASATASGSTDAPYPTQALTPVYPAQALFDGVVLVETAVTEQGTVSEASILAGGEGFEAVALDAARQWRFRPATRDGRPVASYAYLIFGFRQPIIG